MLNALNTLSLQSYGAKLSSPGVRKVLTLTLILASLLMLGLIIKLLLSPPPTIAAADSLRVASSAASLRWNWFPAARSNRVVEASKTTTDEHLAKASIKVQLLGVVITDSGSYAAISTSNNRNAVYKVGDSIENNVTLEEIQDYRVVISQRGSRRQIPLKSLDKAGNQRNNKERLIEVNQSRQSVSSSGFNLSGLVSANPVQLPDGAIGLKLSALSDDLTDLADLQEGDLVLAVNGRAVSELLTNPLLWQQFSQQTNMPITIMRGEQQLELFVNAASLSARILPRIGAGLVN